MFEFPKTRGNSFPPCVDNILNPCFETSESQGPVAPAALGLHNDPKNGSEQQTSDDPETCMSTNGPEGQVKSDDGTVQSVSPEDTSSNCKSINGRKPKNRHLYHQGSTKRARQTSPVSVPLGETGHVCPPAKLSNGDTATHKFSINSTPFRSDTGGDSSPAPQSSNTGRAVSSKCSTRDNKTNTKESSTIDSYHKGSNAVNDTAQSCHNGDILYEAADSSHNGSNSATLSCHNGDNFERAMASSGDTDSHTFNHNTCIFKKRVMNKNAGMRNFYGRPHNASTKHVDSNFARFSLHNKITDKTFCDDHREINRLLVNYTGNDKPTMGVIGTHSLPSSSVSNAGGRGFSRNNKKAKDNKSPNSISTSDESFVNKRRRLLCTPTAPSTFGGTNILHDPTNLLHTSDRGRNNPNAQANSVCPDAPCGIGSPTSRTWLSRLFHPPET